MPCVDLKDALYFARLLGITWAHCLEAQNLDYDRTINKFQLRFRTPNLYEKDEKQIRKCLANLSVV